MLIYADDFLMVIHENLKTKGGLFFERFWLGREE